MRILKIKKKLGVVELIASYKDISNYKRINNEENTKFIDYCEKSICQDDQLIKGI